MERNLAECIVDVINTEGITCCRFNRNGTILAAGCYDGKAVLFDWNIKGVLRHGIAPSRAVAQICWNQAQDQVITASAEGIIVFGLFHLSFLLSSISLETNSRP